MAEWATETVERCLERLSLSSLPKLQTRDYQATGRYPIVDQGQRLIAGWTDDGRGLISTHLPLVVFGDHTRAFKYVDFPFVRGADGTQVLKPRPGIDPLFFYYACRAIDLPARGYNRHFTLLKEKTIPIPPFLEQREIGLVLRRVEDAAHVQTQQLTVTQELKRAAMRELFARGLRGEAQRQTEIGLLPESWDTASVESAVIPLRFDRSKQLQTSSYAKAGRWPIIDQGQSLVAGYTDDESRLIESSVPVIIFGDHTRVFKFIDFAFALGADGTKPLLAKQDYDPKFLFHALCGLEIPSRGYNRHYKLLAEMLIPKPSPAEQAEIAAILDAIDGKTDMCRRKRTVLDGLFKALLHKLMAGEVRVSDIDLSARAPLAKAEAAA